MTPEPLKDKLWEFDEAMAELVKSHAEKVDTEFQRDGHWSMGCNEKGFNWSYYCCETCDQWDYEDNISEEALRKHFKNTNGLWHKTK